MPTPKTPYPVVYIRNKTYHFDIFRDVKLPDTDIHVLFGTYVRQDLSVDRLKPVLISIRDDSYVDTSERFVLIENNISIDIEQQCYRNNLKVIESEDSIMSYIDVLIDRIESARKDIHVNQYKGLNDIKMLLKDLFDKKELPRRDTLEGFPHGYLREKYLNRYPINHPKDIFGEYEKIKTPYQE